MDNEIFINENKDKIEEIRELLSFPSELSRHEIDLLIKWREELDYDWPVVMAALGRARASCGRRFGTMFLYADKLLQMWQERGLRTVQDIEALDKKFAEEQKRRDAYKTQRKTKPQSMTITHDPHYSRRGLVELKPCPFCGSTDVVVKNQFSSRHNAYYTLVECVFCGANTRTSMYLTDADPDSEEFWKSDSVKEVAVLWNTRAYEYG